MLNNPEARLYFSMDNSAFTNLKADIQSSSRSRAQNGAQNKPETAANTAAGARVSAPMRRSGVQLIELQAKNKLHSSFVTQENTKEPGTSSSSAREVARNKHQIDENPRDLLKRQV